MPGSQAACPAAGTTMYSASGQARCRVRGMDDQASSALASLLAPLAAAASVPSTLAAPPESRRLVAAGPSLLSLAVNFRFLPIYER